MEIDKLFVLVGGGGLLVFIYVWFLSPLLRTDKKTGVVSHDNEQDVMVDGGYKPDKIIVKKGKKVTLTFLRKDPSSCLDEVILPDFKISTFLPLNEKTSVSFVPQKSGTFNFSCGMRMFHGQLVVED